MFESDLKHPSKALEEKLYKLYTLNRDKTIDLSFRPPFLNLLKELGNPQANLPPVIHVAGTNGKGSIIATLKSIYEAAGYSVHTYTSPHLIRFNERIVLNGKPIDNQALENLIDEALDKNNGDSCTFFEITTAIAFTAFARNSADICLLEVGMGGRLDCTNLIPSPAATIINTIGLDHTEFLGETYDAIAAEKAGIMKDQTPCIIGAQNNTDTHKVFESKAKETGAILVQSNSLNGTYKETALVGAHQKRNAQTALKTIETLQKKFPVPVEKINEGLTNVKWPARMQQLPSDAFGQSQSTQIWLDGGHNEDAGKAIAQTLKELKKKGNIAVILCMMKHKDPKGFVETFISHCDELFVTQLPHEPSSLTTQQLSKLVDTIPHTQTQSYKDALNKAKSSAPAHILITGSLYLAGHVLQDLEN